MRREGKGRERKAKEKKEEREVKIRKKMEGKNIHYVYHNLNQEPIEC